ncbi:MAG TPA: DoxX family protein, partial [Candidatus Limnocylindrales bacterium]|nr:DoxX family protein [Candidatus Limnocylindrales bacterium]
MLEIALAIPRVLVGLLMVGHGLQKLTGAFGGPGLAGWAGALDGMGIRPGRVWAPIVAFAETVGGALLALGLFGPIGSLLVAADLAVAILVVHLARGLWSQNGGYEYPLVLIAVAVAAAIAGPVDWTLDRVLG